ncbi:MAG: TetM/TetW/TetO/TetS family tetracycline resistance ribosomal protection protein [Oscillospiraceae bacterium]|nr:TetM/TetW/TetO/TetS family tetracycline resistance ribosomal protection protein [Oscillospiraceae bacterium]
MKQIAAGILAHVDAGKTTLSEGLLYTAGEIRRLGRVDARDSFLDTNEIERKRGITIFSKQAVMTLKSSVVTLLDTPGHVDFAAEAERTLSVLDCAILVISATDGVQSHTKTLWEMLERHKTPVFVFINKMDLAGSDKEAVIENLKTEFGGNFVDFTDARETVAENLAVCDEALMEEFLEGSLSEKSVADTIKKRAVFPCFAGSALKMEGVESFLKVFDTFATPIVAMEDFGAKVFKISHDDKGSRLTFMKVTGGSLKVRSTIEPEKGIVEKINEIRIYSGDKYKTVDEAFPGCVCAVTGPKRTVAGQGLGFEKRALALTAEPIFTYRVILPKGTEPSFALEKFKELEQEETQLKVSWNEHLKEIQLRLMGEIQLEVLKQLVLKRFGMPVEFEEGRIVYKETIENAVEGVGHFEPLRHYAEVHLLLSPLPSGAGMQFEIDCPESVLDKNWQRLILTHLMEKQHLGTLTGSPITDIKITLKSGAAHLKHTEGGDFREATYRAVRNGLMRAKSVLLEPYYAFSIELPPLNVGRAMTDLELLGAEFSIDRHSGEQAKIEGRAPAAAIRNYQQEITAYTRGEGHVYCSFDGYGKCKNAAEVIEKIGYNADADVENTADSVFCSHGAGFNVKWHEVEQYMHLESVLKPKADVNEKPRSRNFHASEDELIAIFEMTYGKIKRKLPIHDAPVKREVPLQRKTLKTGEKQEKSYLLIDGYNIIFAWEELKKTAEKSLEEARVKLIDLLSVYNVFTDSEIILVFDAYKVKGNRGEVESEKGITVVYTKEAQTADAYIEKTVRSLSGHHKVTVATSDRLEQIIIFGSGAYRLSASQLEQEVEKVERAVAETVEEHNLKTDSKVFSGDFAEKLLEWQKRNEK